MFSCWNGDNWTLDAAKQRAYNQLLKCLISSIAIFREICPRNASWVEFALVVNIFQDIFVRLKLYTCLGESREKWWKSLLLYNVSCWGRENNFQWPSFAWI